MARGSKSKSTSGSRGKAKPAALPRAEVRPARAFPDTRRWIYAALDILFAVTQAILILKVIPNRLPSASFHLWTLPACTLILGLAMLRGGRHGWLVGVIAGSAALLSAVLLIVRIVISAAFLSGVYGAFGKAAAMTAMISVALLVELVALLPIVQVKYLLTRAGRKSFGVFVMIERRRLVALVLVWTLPSVLFLGTAAFVYGTFRIPQPERLDDLQRTAVMHSLRAALTDKPAIPCALDQPVDEVLAVTVWSKGRPLARIDGHGDTIGLATEDAAIKLRSAGAVKALPGPDRDEARLQVDVITGSAPLGGIDAYAVPGIAEMLAINPGVEGIGTEFAGNRVVLLPNELVAAKVLAAKRPSNALPDFAMGIDLTRIGNLLAARAGLKTAVAPDELFRFRTDTFVELPRAMRPGPPIQLYRGNVTPPPLSAKTLREAALAGGRFLVAHLAPNGRYIYEHELSTGQQTDPVRSSNYSMPRHAGTTYFLAELYRITKEEWLREPIERAFHHLAELLATGKCGSKLPDGTEIDCVLDRNESIAQLGSTALAVVALAEYQRATGDATYLPIATKFAAFLLFMQRGDGSFRHLYDPKTQQPDDKSELLYYSGEASLALARMYVVTKDQKYATAADKGLAWLVAWYDFFMGGFFYGEEHWTCIASEAAWPSANNPEYKDFCHGYGAFLRAQQPVPGEHPDQNDFAGAYNVTSFVPPYNTPAGSRTEAMISAYLLGKHHGTPDPAVREQIRAALQYALGQQIRPENDFNVVGPGLGGMPGSPIDRNVRIDFVQHVCSAMIRASEWIDEPQ